MKVLIADGDELSRVRLRELVAAIEPDCEFAEAMSGDQVIEQADAGAPDIVLMDVRMPVMDGLQAASYLMSLKPSPAVIFATAYEGHALEAFEVNAIDYLLKPVRQNRLELALRKAQRYVRSRAGAAGNAERVGRSHISVNTRGRIRLIPVGDIVYFMAEAKYVTVRTADQRFLIESSLARLEHEFSDRFLRVHRNALVSVSHIHGLERQASGNWSVILQNLHEPLPVSRRRLSAIRRWARV